MLHGIDPRVTPELMDCLMRMGHGDEIVVVDANFPALTTATTTVWGEVIQLPGFTSPEAISLITALMPLDGFTDTCALRMEIDNQPDTLGEVHQQAFKVIEAAKPDGAIAGSIERQQFYLQSAQAFAVVATTDIRPFGCFILRKGVIF